MGSGPSCACSTGVQTSPLLGLHDSTHRQVFPLQYSLGQHLHQLLHQHFGVGKKNYKIEGEGRNKQMLENALLLFTLCVKSPQEGDQNANRKGSGENTEAKRNCCSDHLNIAPQTLEPRAESEHFLDPFCHHSGASHQKSPLHGSSRKTSSHLKNMLMRGNQLVLKAEDDRGNLMQP